MILDTEPTPGCFSRRSSASNTSSPNALGHNDRLSCESILAVVRGIDRRVVKTIIFSDPRYALSSRTVGDGVHGGIVGTDFNLRLQTFSNPNGRLITETESGCNPSHGSTY